MIWISLLEQARAFWCLTAQDSIVHDSLMWRVDASTYAQFAFAMECMTKCPVCWKHLCYFVREWLQHHRSISLICVINIMLEAVIGCCHTAATWGSMRNVPVIFVLSCNKWLCSLNFGIAHYHFNRIQVYIWFCLEQHGSGCMFALRAGHRHGSRQMHWASSRIHTSLVLRGKVAKKLLEVSSIGWLHKRFDCKLHVQLYHTYYK